MIPNGCRGVTRQRRALRIAVVTWAVVTWAVVTWAVVTWAVVTWAVVTWAVVTWAVVTWATPRPARVRRGFQPATGGSRSAGVLALAGFPPTP